MHRVTHRYIARHEGDEVVTYEAGDAFEPTDAELQSFGDRLEPVEEDVTPGGNASEPPLEPSEYTVDEFEAELDGGEYDDYLDELEELEAAGKDRQGVYDAIEDRR